ncbi:MAG TPA: hypothetical protein VL201_04785 [Patescibacteria group bacterium]|nr:hypothetical protein [Patescibacteria group bacterium]
MTFHKQIQKSSFLSLTILFLKGFYLISIHASELPINEILQESPEQLEEFHSEIFDTYFKDCYNLTEENYNIWPTKVKEAEIKSPIFTIKECDTEKCLLSRSMESRYRKYFECCVLKMMDSRINQERNINWVSFGTGALLQDLIIMNKLLTQNTKLSIQLHFIDIIYFELMVFLKSIQNSSGFNVSTFADDSLLNNLNDLRQCQLLIKEESPDLKYKIYWQYIGFKQFVEFLCKKFPLATLSFSVHDTADSFLSFVKIDKDKLPDFITAVDIEDRVGREDDPIPSYITLCTEILQLNPESKNIWLSKRDINKRKPAVVLQSIVNESKGVKYLNKKSKIECFLTQEFL